MALRHSHGRLSSCTIDAGQAALYSSRPSAVSQPCGTPGSSSGSQRRTAPCVSCLWPSAPSSRMACDECSAKAADTAHAEQQGGDREPAAIDVKQMLPADQESAEIAQPGEAALDGLLTNDKFCLTRTALLPLSWSRQPLRLRTVSLQNRGSVHAGGTDEPHAHLEHPTPDLPAQRRADPMGSGLSAPAAVDDQSRGTSGVSSRPSGRCLMRIALYARSRPADKPSSQRQAMRKPSSNNSSACTPTSPARSSSG